MRQTPTTGEQQTKTTAPTDPDTISPDTAIVIRVLNEVERVEPIGEEPNPDYATFAMKRDAPMYGDSEVDGDQTRQARVSIPADVYGDPHEAAERFRIRYTEAFDQLLPHFGADEWIAVHRFVKASDGVGLCVTPDRDPDQGVIA